MEHNQGNGAASLKWSIIREMQQVLKIEQNQGNEAGQGNGAESGKCIRAGKWSRLREMKPVREMAQTHGNEAGQGNGAGSG